MIGRDDNKIWKLVCEGDRAAFEVLYKSFAKILYQYGLSFTAKIELIEDCIQELFIRVYKNHKNLQKEVNVRYYLLKAFRNNLVRILEKEKKYSYSDNDEYCFDITFSVECEIITEEKEQKQQAIIKNGINKLSARQKEIIYLRYTKGLNYREIAHVMNMGLESCRNLNSKSISSLRCIVGARELIFFFISKKS